MVLRIGNSCMGSWCSPLTYYHCREQSAACQRCVLHLRRPSRSRTANPSLPAAVPYHMEVAGEAFKGCRRADVEVEREPERLAMPEAGERERCREHEPQPDDQRHGKAAVREGRNHYYNDATRCHEVERHRVRPVPRL